MHKVRCILVLSLLSLTHAGAAHGQWVQMNGAGVTVPAGRAVQKLTLTVVRVDSEETGAKGAYAVDGNPNTIWHTQWKDASPAHPHEIILQLDPPCRIKGLTYLPRQDGYYEGTIVSYEIYVSINGKDFGQPVKKGGLFPYGRGKRTVVFEAKQCGFVKLVALSDVKRHACTSAAEIGVIQEDEHIVLDEIVIHSGPAIAVPSPFTPVPLIRRDPLEAKLVAGTFATPKEGAVPLAVADASDGKPTPAWTAITANANGVFKSGNYTAFPGGWVYATVENATERVMLLEAYGHRSVFVNGDPIPGILFGLHGANSEAMNVAGKFSPKKEAHVVCPTNRGPDGFAWEDWGCIDFTEAAAHARANLVNAPRRSWLTGGSMGGQGTWLLGARFPDEFAAIAPTSAWLQDYTPSTETPPGPAPTDDPANTMLLRAGRRNHILSLKENYLKQGVYVLHGDADEEISVDYAREMFKQLAAISHPDFQYCECPGYPHWWSTALDWPPKIEFLFRHVLPEPNDITRVRFRTWAPQVSYRNAWVRVLQQEQPFEVSSVDVSMDVAKRTITAPRPTWSRWSWSRRSHCPRPVRLPISLSHLTDSPSPSL